MRKVLTRSFNLARFLYSQRVRGFDVSDEPWLDAETSAWLEKRLRTATCYLEFGSGGSTRLSGRLGILTITVEGDRFFARAVRDGLADGHNVHLVDAPIGFTGPWGVPMPGKPNKARVARWKSYIELPFNQIEKRKLPFPDLVLIDGRFRRACALQTALKAKKYKMPTTILFDDYFENRRMRYSRVESIIGGPERLGRSAIFHISGSENVTQEDVDSAIRDYL